MPKPSQIVAQLQRENAALKAAIARYATALEAREVVGMETPIDVACSTYDAMSSARDEMYSLAGIESVKK